MKKNMCGHCESTQENFIVPEIAFIKYILSNYSFFQSNGWALWGVAIAQYSKFFPSVLKKENQTHQGLLSYSRM